MTILIALLSVLITEGMDQQTWGIILPTELEIRLALSAAPRHLQPEAGIYVLEAKGYRRVRASKNGFECLVTRPDFGTQLGCFEPQCYGPEAVKTIVPAVIENARLRALGLSNKEIDRRMREGFDSGRFQKPSRQGVVYMLSPANRVALRQDGLMVSGGGIVPAPPHIMFFGTDLDKQELGIQVSGARPAWLPILTAENSYWAWVVMMLGPDAEREIREYDENVKLVKDMGKYLNMDATGSHH